MDSSTIIEVTTGHGNTFRDHLAERLEFFEGQRMVVVDGNADQLLDKRVGETIDRVRAVKTRLFLDAGNLPVVIHFFMFGSHRVSQTREGMDLQLVLDGGGDVFVTDQSAVGSSGKGTGSRVITTDPGRAPRWPTYPYPPTHFPHGTVFGNFGSV